MHIVYAQRPERASVELMHAGPGDWERLPVRLDSISSAVDDVRFTGPYRFAPIDRGNVSGHVNPVLDDRGHFSGSGPLIDSPDPMAIPVWRRDRVRWQVHVNMKPPYRALLVYDSST